MKPEASIVTYPPEWVTKTPTLNNYFDVITTSSMLQNYLNSILIVTGTIFVIIVLGAHAVNASARFDFRGKNTLLFILLATIIVPGIVTLIPLYLVAVQIGLHNTYIIQILVFAAWQTPTIVWLLRSFFENIPGELEDAALVDGCTRMGAFYIIVLPLAQPGLIAGSIEVFVSVWNEFLIALNLTGSNAVRPLGENGIQWGDKTAAACLALLPVICLFALLQCRFIQGLTSRATKG